MIITRSPFRISLFGGGTDFPIWYQDNGGLCVGMAVNLYSYLFVKKLPGFFDYNIKLSYATMEMVNEIWEIQHGGIREVLNELVKVCPACPSNYEIHHTSDVPSRTGLGSSSSFLVGLLHGIFHSIGIKQEKRELANLANHIERVVLQEAGGLQDSIWAAYGGINSIEFIKGDGKFSDYVIRPIKVADNDVDYLTSCMVLLYTGRTRTAAEITQSYAKTLDKKVVEQSALMDIAFQGISAVKNIDLLTIGKLLNENWKIKRSLSDKVSTSEIDAWYELSLKSGAFGSKILGAGGGGCLLSIVPYEKVNDFIEKMKPLIHIPFAVDMEGSKVISNGIK